MVEPTHSVVKSRRWNVTATTCAGLVTTLQDTVELGSSFPSHKVCAVEQVPKVCIVQVVCCIGLVKRGLPMIIVHLERAWVFGVDDAGRELESEVVLVDVRVVAEHGCLCGFFGCLDFLGMPVCEADFFVKGRAFAGGLEVFVVSSHVDTTDVALEIAAVGASHLVAAVLLDEGSLAFVARANEGLAHLLFNLVAEADGSVLGAFALVLFARVGNMASMLALATADDSAGRVEAAKLKVNVNRRHDSLEVAERAAFNVLNARALQLFLHTETHEPIDQDCRVGHVAQLHLQKRTRAAGGTNELGAGLTKLHLHVSAHAAEARRVCSGGVAMNNFIQGRIVVANTATTGQQSFDRAKDGVLTIERLYHWPLLAPASLVLCAFQPLPCDAAHWLHGRPFGQRGNVVPAN